MLVDTDVCVRVVFVWEETRMPEGNPPVWLSDHMTIPLAHAEPTPGIEPGSQRWEASALTLRQPDSYIVTRITRDFIRDLIIWQSYSPALPANARIRR